MAFLTELCIMHLYFVSIDVILGKTNKDRFFPMNRHSDVYC